MSMLLLAVLSGFALALLAPLLHRFASRWSGWILAALPAALTGYFWILLREAGTGTATVQSTPWLPVRGVHLSLFADGLGALFALVISAVGTLIVIYAGGYFRGHPYQGRFFSFILAFMASMLGVALSNNLLLLYVFWELTSLTSYLLIAFDHEDEAARSSALQALLVTGAGGLAMLAGFVLLGQAGGTYQISELIAHADTLAEHELYPAILLLVLAGAFTKSAQFPFHFWLPNAMAAPTPVSAYLHSATMVKAGVYLLARLSPILGGTTQWLWFLSVAGGITMLLGAWLALQQTDLKRLLAYSTISVLGTLTLLLGVGTENAVTAMVVMLVAHAGYKGTLFLIAGSVDHATGTRDITRLSGLARSMPITATASIIAALSMMGLPPFIGFLSKEALYQSLSDSSTFEGWLLGACVAAKVLLIVVAIKVGIRPFLGSKNGSSTAHEVGGTLWLGPALLAAFGAACGLTTGTMSNVAETATQAVTQSPANVHLAFWHGLGQPFILSIVTLVSGVGLFFLHHRLLAAFGSFRVLESWGPDRAYNWLIHLIKGAAGLQARLLQSGYLRVYVIIIVTTTVLLTSSTAFYGTRHLHLEPPGVDGVRFHELAVAAIILLAAVMATVVRSRLAAVAALGAVGYGVALIFVLFAAPDLAITQFSLETLSIILFLAVVYRLPRFAILATPASRIRDALVSGAAGILITLLVLSVTASPSDSRVSRWLAESSKPLAHGRNVVNVILVDFRALDTLGEITVLAASAIGVFALMKLRLADTESN